jgi:hypothetical protein
LEHTFSWVFFEDFELFVGDNIDEEIENFGVVDAGIYVTFLG